MKPALFFCLISFIHINLIAQNCVSGDCWNGYGKVVFTEPYEHSYEGQFSEGKWHGDGKIIVKGQFEYTGTFTNHQVTGKGTVKLANGSKYNGEVVNANFEGEGIYYYPDGKTLEGIFRNGNIYNGKGYVPSPNGNYEGTIESGKFNGEGTYYHANGNVYTGSFVDGSPEGQGTLRLANGDKYSGHFKGGQLNGQGDFQSSTGLKYEGQFANDQFNGYGEATYHDGIFKGYWAAGKRHGSGKFYDKQGTLQYDGQWRDDQPTQLTVAAKEEFLRQAKSAFSDCFNGGLELNLYGNTGVMKLKACFQIHNDFSISGTLYSTLKIDYVEYDSSIGLKGSVDPETNKIYFYETEFISKESLPNGLYWMNDGVYYGNITKHPDHTGYYIIHGSTRDNQRFELSNY